jgi:hypothetical protein
MRYPCRVPKISILIRRGYEDRCLGRPICPELMLYRPSGNAVAMAAPEWDVTDFTIFVDLFEGTG